MRRLIALVAVTMALMVLSFAMVRLIPGDVALNVLGIGATASDLSQVRQDLGLNHPPLEQFQTYVSNVLHGDFGHSFQTKESVRGLIIQRLPLSAALAAWSLFLVMVVSIPLGMLLGALTQEGRHQRLEVAFTGLASVLGTVPQFLTATFLVFVFAVSLKLLPVGGSDTWDSWILPVMAIAISPMFILSRIVRVETLNVLAQDYMRTARSNRLTGLTIYFRHALPNVLTGALTIGGLLFANIVGGAILVENIFARAGLGTSLVQAVLAKDYPVVQGIVLILGVVVVLVNTVVDVILGILDPRSLTSES
jgi:peptide/nickel transport system permease protein